MKTYHITKLSNPNPNPNWQDIPHLSIDTYPWYESGLKQDTQVQLAYNNQALFININARDKYSFSKQTELNHMLICEDSCVEFFFSPSGTIGSSYLNLEVNCCGTLHIAYGPDRHSRKHLPINLASFIRRTASIKSPVKIESPEDKSWCVEIILPFKTITEFTGEKINLEQWYGNFYRCGGRREPQYAVWSNIEAEEPDYHRPENFAELKFTE